MVICTVIVMLISMSIPTRWTSKESSSPLCSSSSGILQVLLKAVEFITVIVMSIGGELGARKCINRKLTGHTQIWILFNTVVPRVCH